MKDRADKMLVARGLAPTREKAQALIMAGLVFSGETRVEKPGAGLAADAPLTVRRPLPFVSRAGLKLAEALDRCGVDPSGVAAADIGASTGGFTDCLLQRGARRVYAVDVDTRQLDRKLRDDPRVIGVEKNARYLVREDFPETPELFTVDVAFISVLKVLAALASFVRRGTLLVLVKPQFEAGRGRVGRKGIVRDPAVHAEVLDRVIRSAAELGFEARAIVRSSTRGQRGNVEFFVRFSPERSGVAADRIAKWIEEAVHHEEG
jgi:23S rRNA (cytidine1920-2'-O)/16S rRNA (cytidine1409-2'-O)-methyltransferase